MANCDLLEVVKDKKHGLFDINGKEIITAEYDKVDVGCELVAVKQKGKWGCFDLSGKELFGCEYKKIDLYESKKDKIRAKKGDEWGYVDENGKWTSSD